MHKERSFHWSIEFVWLWHYLIHSSFRL